MLLQYLLVVNCICCVNKWFWISTISSAGGTVGIGTSTGQILFVSIGNTGSGYRSGIQTVNVAFTN